MGQSFSRIIYLKSISKLFGTCFIVYVKNKGSYCCSFSTVSLNSPWQRRHPRRERDKILRLKIRPVPKKITVLPLGWARSTNISPNHPKRGDIVFRTDNDGNYIYVVFEFSTNQRDVFCRYQFQT